MTGSGTLLDPYIIWDVNDLQNIELDRTAYYELGQDIDASATVGWHGGAGFVPISADFTGHLDGKGFAVTDLFIDRPAQAAALFWVINDVAAEVKNLGLENVNIRGASASCFVDFLMDGTITNCHCTGRVEAVTSGAGGFAYITWGTISRCRSNCTVVANWDAGGFVCGNDWIISQCYALGKVTNSGAFGASGFVNENWGTVSDCYTRVDVEATAVNAKAVAFCHDNGTTIERCYAAGVVTAVNAPDEYGVCFNNWGAITDCFWDTETSGTITSNGGIGKTTAEMKTQSTFTDAGWDFTTPIWYINSTINDGYPAFIGVVTRIKGNPHIDQRIYQHVERMER